MSKKSKKVIVEKLDNPLESLEDAENESLEASKQPAVKSVPVVESEPKPEPKSKRPLTDAQKAVLIEGRKKGREKLEQRNAQINAEREEMKRRLDEMEQEIIQRKQKEFEDKVVKKALSVKKKQIKRDSILDEISDDETSITKIKEMKAKVKSKPKENPVTTPSQPTTRMFSYPKIIFI
jgi:hypothetical protein